jgi:hypothetical protein
VIDGSSMLIGTISVVFRHVCVLFGAKEELTYHSLSSSIRVISQYIKIHMAVQVYPTLSC